MATGVSEPLIIQKGQVRLFPENDDGGFAAALIIGFQPGSEKPPILNYGELRFQSVPFGRGNFIAFSSSVSWREGAPIQNFGLIEATAVYNNDVKVLFPAGAGVPDLYNAGTIQAQGRITAIVYESWRENIVTNVAGGLISATAQESAISIYMPNGGTVVNSGHIVATNTGGTGVARGAAAISAAATGGLTVENSGVIEAIDGVSDLYATAIGFYGMDDSIVRNSGTIRGDYAIVEGNPHGYPVKTLVQNTGRIEGAIDLAAGDDRIENSGTVVGSIYLGAGNDLYDGSGGTASGGVYADEGDDHLIGGSGSEKLDGGAGDDLLVGGGGADILIGGAGNDRIFYDPTDNASQVNGGDGFDTLVCDGVAPSLLYDLRAGGFERAEIYIRDPGNNSWDYVRNINNADWQLIGQEVRNDDGSYRMGEFDTGTAAWNQVWYSYDALNRLSVKEVRYDDGSYGWASFDFDDSRPWSEAWFSYDAAGQKLSEDYRYDDGTRSWVSIDASATQDWAQVWFTYDRQGRQISEDYRYDDGRRSWVSIDATNLRTWQQAWFTYDEARHKISEDYRYDDGSRSWVAIDATDSQGWSQVWFSYDALGRQTSQDWVSDMGSRIWTAFDADGSKDWSQSAYYYGVSGNLYQQVTSWDDGSTTTTLF